jgi:hypothetical protein
VVGIAEIAERTGIDPGDVTRALHALSGPYVDFETIPLAEGDSIPLYVRGVTPDARRAVGQWPTPESLVARIVEGVSDAAERETDPQRRKRLREVASLLGGTAKEVVTEIVAKVIVRGAGMG